MVLLETKMMMVITNNSKTITSKSIKYKTKIIDRTPNDNNALHTEVAVPLK